MEKSKFSIATIIVVILIIFYGSMFIRYGIDSTFKGDDYIPSTKYNEYVGSIAKKHIDNNIFEFECDEITSSSNDLVTLRYTFITSLSNDELEEYAYEEVKYVYESVKDTRIKKDELAAPGKKDLLFLFFVNIKNNKEEIGRAKIFHIFGSLDGSSYIDDHKTIIFKDYKGNYIKEKRIG